MLYSNNYIPHKLHFQLLGDGHNDDEQSYEVVISFISFVIYDNYYYK